MKGEGKSTVALVIAGILLLGVGAYSYHDYVKSKLEKEFSEKEMALGQERELLLAQTEKMRDSGGAGTAEKVPEQSPGQLPAGAVAVPPSQASGVGTAQMPDVPLPPIPSELLNTGMPGAGGESKKDPAAARLEKMEADLAALKKENQLYQRTLNGKAKGKGKSVENTTVPDRPAQRNLMPDSSAKPDEAELNAMAEKIRTAAAIAKVVDYDPDWAFVVIDRGRNSKIEAGIHFAVRRGSEILGFIRITEVHDTYSVGDLKTRNKHSPTARKPAAGDDVIAANPF